MVGRRKYFLGRLRKVSHKGTKHTRAFIAPSSGNFRSNLEVETDLYLSLNDKVKFYMEKGEPIIVSKVKRTLQKR